MPKYLSFEDQAEIDAIEKNLTDWRLHRHQGVCKTCTQQALLCDLMNMCNPCFMKLIYPGGIKYA